MDNQLVIAALDQARHISPKGTEFWRAREIQKPLEYEEWRNFEQVIKKAMMACETTGCDQDRHFGETTIMVEVGSGAKRTERDYYLTRYACYLVAMNGSPGKPQIAAAQTYFAVQTRRQENFDALTEQTKRVHLRERVKDANKHLNSAAKTAGVAKYGLFHDAGYRGLYGDLGVRDIKNRKGIPENEDLMDRAGRAELAANEFRITQTEQVLAKDRVRGETLACDTHHRVGSAVRRTIQEIGGRMPENLPAEPSIKKLTRPPSRKSLPPPPAKNAPANPSPPQP